MFIVTVIVIIFVVDTAGAVKTTVEDVAALRAVFDCTKDTYRNHIGRGVPPAQKSLTVSIPRSRQGQVQKVM